MHFRPSLVNRNKWIKCTVLTKLKEQNGACYYCGIKIRPNTVTADHVHPQCHGGTDDEDNIVACCQPCNMTKGPMSVKKFKKYLRSTDNPYYGERRFHLERARFRFKFFKEVDRACKRIKGCVK